MEYDKLVRDKIPKIIKSSGKDCDTEILRDENYTKYLYKKLDEEVNEFLEDDTLEELADIMEVIHGILILKNYTFEELEETRLYKLRERGGFGKKVLLKRVFIKPQSI